MNLMPPAECVKKYDPTAKLPNLDKVYSLGNNSKCIQMLPFCQCNLKSPTLNLQTLWHYQKTQIYMPVL